MERDQWASWNINLISLEYLLSGIKHPEMFLFASTDSVYGSGEKEHLFCEEDRLDPVNLYGTQKVAGEAIVTHYGGNVFRYPLLLGPSIIKGRRHFYDDLVESLRNGRPVELFEDSYRSTLDFRTAAELTAALIVGHGGRLPPVLNIAGDEALSKYDVGIRLAARLGISEKLVIPIRTVNGGHIYRTPRAACTLLDNTRMKRILALDTVRMQFEV